MSITTLTFVTMIFLCGLAGILRAENLSQPFKEVEQIDMEKVKSSISMAEMDWQNNNYISYYETMTNLCRAIVGRSDVSEANYILFLRIVSQILIKPHEVVMPRNIVWTNYRHLAGFLTQDTLVAMHVAPEKFSSLRSKNTRLLMVCLASVQAARVPNFTPKPVFNNVAPPINPGNEALIAGMDPAVVKDPIARAAYEKAILENAKRAEVNSEQNSLEKIIKNDLPKMEEYLVKVYSKTPRDDAELAEYMILGKFETSKIVKVISEINR